MMRGLQHVSQWHGGAPSADDGVLHGVVPLWRTDSRSAVKPAHEDHRGCAPADRWSRTQTEAALELENASSRPRPDGPTDTHVRGGPTGRRVAAAVVCAALTIVVSITQSSGASASVHASAGTATTPTTSTTTPTTRARPHRRRARPHHDEHDHTNDEHDHTNDEHDHTDDEHDHTDDEHDHTDDEHDHTDDEHDHTDDEHRPHRRRARPTPNDEHDQPPKPAAAGRDSPIGCVRGNTRAIVCDVGVGGVGRVVHLAGGSELVRAHPEWFVTPSRAGGPLSIPVPAATPVFAVTTGTVASVTPEPSGLQVVLTGSDGATYTYGGGQAVNVHWGEQHPYDGSQAVKVHPGEQVIAGQELLEAGCGRVQLEDHCPRRCQPGVCAAGAGILGGGDDGGCARAADSRVREPGHGDDDRPAGRDHCRSAERGDGKPNEPPADR